MEVKLKLLVLFFVPLLMQKVKKVKSINIQSDCETQAKREQTYPVFLHSVKNYKKVENVNTQND